MNIEQLIQKAELDIRFYAERAEHHTRYKGVVKTRLMQPNGSRPDYTYAFLFSSSDSNCGLIYLDHVTSFERVLPYTYGSSVGKALYAIVSKISPDDKRRMELSHKFFYYYLYNTLKELRKDSEYFRKNLLFCHVSIGRRKHDYEMTDSYKFFSPLFDSSMISPMNKNSENYQLHGIIDFEKVGFILSQPFSKELEDLINAYTDA